MSPTRAISSPWRPRRGCGAQASHISADAFVERRLSSMFCFSWARIALAKFRLADMENGRRADEIVMHATAPGSICFFDQHFCVLSDRLAKKGSEWPVEIVMA